MDINTLSKEELAKLLPTFTGDTKAAATMRLRALNDADFAAQGEEWSKKQLPENMKRPVAIQVAHHRNGAPVSGGFNLLPRRVPGYRPISPGDVVAVDLEWPEVQEQIARKVAEITNDPVNRPLIYKSELAAKVTRPRELARKAGSEPGLVRQIAQQNQPLVDQIQSQLEAAPSPFTDPTYGEAAAQIEQKKIAAELEAKQGGGTLGPDGTTIGGITRDQATKIETAEVNEKSGGGRRSRS